MDCQRGFSELSPVCSAPSCQAQASNRALGPNKFGFPPRLEQGGDSKGAAASQDCGVADTALYRMKRKCSVCAVESRLPLVAEKITTPKIRFSDVESTTVRLSSVLSTWSLHSQAHVVFSSYHSMGVQGKFK